MLSSVGGNGAAAAAADGASGAAEESALDSAAADAPAGSGHRKRIKRSDYPDLDDAQYKEMMAKRRKEREAERDRNRDRTGRSYPSQDCERAERIEGQQQSAARAVARTPMAPSAPLPQRRLLYNNLMDPGDLDLRELRGWSCVWSQEVPPLVMVHEPLAEKHDDWWQRLERYGMVAGSMLSHNVEDDRLYAAARRRRHSV